MRSCKQLLEALERGALDQNLSALYGGGQIPAARERAIHVTGALMKSFHPIQKAALFSGPGRTDDFRDPENLAIEKAGYDFTKSGHTLCIIDTGSCHADLTGGGDGPGVRPQPESSSGAGQQPAGRSGVVSSEM